MQTIKKQIQEVSTKHWTKRRVTRVRRFVNEAFDDEIRWTGRLNGDEIEAARKQIEKERAETLELIAAFRVTLTE